MILPILYALVAISGKRIEKLYEEFKCCEEDCNIPNSQFLSILGEDYECVGDLVYSSCASACDDYCGAPVVACIQVCVGICVYVHMCILTIILVKTVCFRLVGCVFGLVVFCCAVVLSLSFANVDSCKYVVVFRVCRAGRSIWQLCV